MKSILPYLMMIVFLAIFVVAIIYVSRRFAYYFNSKRKWPWYISFTSLFVLMIIGGLAFQNATGQFGHILYIFAALLMGFLLYVLMSVILMDLVRLVFKVKPKICGIVVIGLAVLVSVYGIFNAFDLQTTKTDIPVKGLKKELKVMLLSDIHVGHFRSSDFIKDVVNRTKQLNPDMVFITGDYLDGKIELKDENFEPLRLLNVPIFFIGGNHDEHSDLETIKEKMRGVGVKVMENEIADFENIQVVGLDYMLADNEAFDMHPSADKQTIKEVLPGLKIDREKPAILLHHSPVGVKYAKDQGIDLFLAGHVHAGQMFPLTLISKLFFPYNVGLYDYRGMKIFVSEGAGTFGAPMRVGTKCEINFITLKPDVK